MIFSMQAKIMKVATFVAIAAMVLAKTLSFEAQFIE